MLKAPLTILLALSLLSPFKWFINSFKAGATPIDVASASTVRITGTKAITDIFGETEDKPYVCSGFAIAKKRVLTANHCITPDSPMKFDGHVPGKVIFSDEYYDLALVQDDALDRKPLELRDHDVVRDEGLTAIGYGFGWERLLVIAEVVRIPAYPMVPNSASGIIMQGGLIGGMSGGPIIDQEGFVVGINQRGNNFIAYGVGVTLIRAFLFDAESRDSYDKELIKKFQPAFIPVKEGGKATVDLQVTPSFSLRVPTTIRSTIKTSSDPDARQLCLVWDSESGETGTHCFPHEGERAPKTTVWDFTIHQPGQYTVRATLIRTYDVVNSRTAELYIGVEE